MHALRAFGAVAVVRYCQESNCVQLALGRKARQRVGPAPYRIRYYGKYEVRWRLGVKILELSLV